MFTRDVEECGHQIVRNSKELEDQTRTYCESNGESLGRSMGTLIELDVCDLDLSENEIERILVVGVVEVVFHVPDDCSLSVL